MENYMKIDVQPVFSYSSHPRAMHQLHEKEIISDVQTPAPAATWLQLYERPQDGNHIAKSSQSTELWFVLLSH